MKYHGTKESFRNATVEVTISSSKILEINILEGALDNDRQAAVLTSKMDDLFQSVIESETLKADTVTGATLTSKAHLKALENALKQAQKNKRGGVIMNIAAVSYSYTGNNHLLAESVARELSAAHIQIVPKKKVTTGIIVMDMSFNRTPEVQPAPDILARYDFILFFAPVWLGQAAAPLRAYLQYLKSNPKRYGFLSISGGADGENPKLSKELLKRSGTKPVLVFDQHIKDLLPQEPAPTRKDTSKHKVTEAEIRQLSAMSIKEISKLSLN